MGDFGVTIQCKIQLHAGWDRGGSDRDGKFSIYCVGIDQHSLWVQLQDIVDVIDDLDVDVEQCGRGLRHIDWNIDWVSGGVEYLIIDLDVGRRIDLLVEGGVVQDVEVEGQHIRELLWKRGILNQLEVNRVWAGLGISLYDQREGLRAGTIVKELQGSRSDRDVAITNAWDDGQVAGSLFQFDREVVGEAWHQIILSETLDIKVGLNELHAVDRINLR